MFNNHGLHHISRAKFTYKTLAGIITNGNIIKIYALKISIKTI